MLTRGLITGLGGIILGRNDEGVIAVPLPKRRMRSFVADPRPAL